MNRKSEIFEHVLTGPFDNDTFVGFVKEFLNNIQLVAPTNYNKEYSNFSFYVDGYYHIGNYISDDKDKIAIFSVCLKKGDTVERARGMQRNFVKLTMADIKYEIKEELGILSESAKGWKKELNLVSWNGATPKYDLRDWAPEHEKMGKGITLSADEVQELYNLLSKIVEQQL